MAETAESPEVSHLKALYRDAHLRAENLGRRYQRIDFGCAIHALMCRAADRSEWQIVNPLPIVPAQAA